MTEGGVERRRAPKRSNGEGSIYYQKSRDRWAASVSLENGRRKVLYARSRHEVAQKLQAALNARDQGALVVDPKQTLGRFLERWLQDSVKPTVRVRTYQTYEVKIRLRIVPELGRVSLGSLRPQHLQRLYAAKLDAGLGRRRATPSPA
jgi:integrase